MYSYVLALGHVSQRPRLFFSSSDNRKLDFNPLNEQNIKLLDLLHGLFVPLVYEM